MHLHPPRRTADTRLLSAALELVAERGYRGATTRRIAERAGVAEVTLFRRFKTKARLVAEAVRWATADLGSLAQEPTGDLRTDLVRLARVYNDLIQTRRGLVLRILPELGREPALQKVFREVMETRLGGVFALFQHYQAAGRLEAEPVAAQALAFLGPLFARNLLGEALGLEVPFQPEAYVERYLVGRERRD
ncbi:TetR/AcrR family transcriptional regulator [Marinithermus hydrothermalis]|uniref:Regulatory protein TetR n=1 Tax=Marinithermus hydrothermalis (strain DSM 14884 / JCM 11576 / T1) TaxID=869210 RepID=F2NNG6_MARHT|nr:TetR/AcrR family transcriptional regulator [Marinithermus hydrothermalis]AEB10776.1 regulatory protein TetR [Marinithermus hydrothermalis DSM 14884]